MEENTSLKLPAPPDLLVSLLKDVSRSFYTTLRVLPRPVRPQISLAYLLARTSDTIADSGRVAIGDRLTALEQFRDRVAGVGPGRLSFEKLGGAQDSPAEEVLLKRAEESISILKSFNPADRSLIVGVLDTITKGQRQDLLRFEPRGALIRSLETAEELHNYTYLVAGCVGEFWTRICRLHLFPTHPLEEKTLIEEGIQFGKGLQLVNILRDLASDLRHGRCYIPLDQLKARGLTPEDLLEANNYARFRPLYEGWLDQAEKHLSVGWRYTNRLPWTQMRVRLACAWPLLIGFETIKLLRRGNVLDATTRLKVSRSWVKRMICRSIFYYPAPMLWRKLAGAPDHRGRPAAM